MTLGLFIDSSSEKGVVALYRKEGDALKLIHFKSIANANTLMTDMEKLMDECSESVQDLAFVAAGVGPGSFTGIRVGQMVARSISFAASIPLLGISSLSIYSEEYPVIVDARIGGVWAQFPGQESRMISMADLKPHLLPYSTLVSPDLKLLKSKLISLGYQGEMLEKSPDLNLIARLVEKELKNNDGSRPEIAYLRKTQAEIEKDLLKEKDPLKK